MNDEEETADIPESLKIPYDHYEAPRIAEPTAVKPADSVEHVAIINALGGIKLSTKILLGVLLASLMLLFVGSERITLLLYSFVRADREEQAQKQARLEDLKRQQQRNEALIAQENLRAEQQRRLLEEQKRQKQAELLAKMNQAEKEAKEKQAKWERFYQASPLCIRPKDWKQQVICANERFKAEERFEALYKAGKL